MKKDIAIIGIAGKFPGAEDVNAYFENLMNGVDSVRSIPKERIKSTTLPPDAEYEFSSYLDDVDLFDYEFFGISLGEAREMDPIQRLMLQVAFNAFENTGYNVEHFKGSNTSVYVADAKLEYHRHADVFSGTILTGNSKEFLPSRLNRYFDLRGKSVMVDTSCSSSMVALNFACNDLILGDSDYSVVCAGSLTLFPFKIGNKGLNIMSPEGRSKSFSDKADGMGNGEAIVTIILKTLENAVRDNDNIHAVIKGIALNNNASRSSSFTAPDSESIAEVMKSAWKKGGIHPDELGFIEAHGSGTKMGDSIEIGGIDLAFKEFTDKVKICPISCVKPNIGHTKWASGLVALMKVIMSIKNKTILPTIHFDEPSKIIDFENSAVFVNTEVREWKIEDNKIRYAGLNSIGYSGTNCHVVISEPPLRHKSSIGFESSGTYLIPVSSKTKEGLFSNLRKFKNDLVKFSDSQLSDLAVSAAIAKSHYSYRFIANVTSLSLLENELTHALSNELFSFNDDPKSNLKIIYVVHNKSIQGETVRFFDRYIDNNLRRAFGRAAPLAFNEDPMPSAYGFYKFLNSIGCKPDSVLATPSGKILVDLLSDRISPEDAFVKHGALPEERYENLKERLLGLLSKYEPSQKLCLLEFGDDEIFNASIKEVVKGSQNASSFVFNPSEQGSLNKFISFLYLNHVQLNWSEFYGAEYFNKLELPSYQFARTRCWIRESPKLLSVFDGGASQPIKPENSLQEEGNAIQKNIAEIWCELLKIGSLSLNDNFFELGGDSILATKMISRLNLTFDVKLDFEDIFDFPTIKELYLYINSTWSTLEKISFYWKEVLKIERISPDDNFFELGGHSLIASKIINRINDDFQINLNFEDLFKAPTLGELASYVDLCTNNEVAGLNNKIERIDFNEDYDVSPSQRRMWIVSQFDNSSVAYNNFDVFSISNVVEPDAMQLAFEEIISRHEILRTSFIMKGDGVRQRVHDVNEIDQNVEIVSLGNKTSKDDLIRIAAEEAVKPFDLSVAPLMRMKVLMVDENKTYVLFSMHHIISDFASLKLMCKEFLDFYTAIKSKQATKRQPLEIQYKDYAAWLNKQLQTPNFLDHKNYWLQKFSELPDRTKLPADYPRPPLKTYSGSYFQFDLNLELSNVFLTFCKKNGITPFTLFLASLKGLLYRYSGYSDIILGTPISGRNHVLLENQLGFYTNTLALRTKFDPIDSFSLLLSKVSNSLFEAYEHKEYPFDDLIANLSQNTDPSHSPLFDIMVIEKNINDGLMADISNSNRAESGFDRIYQVSKFDLSIDFRWNENGISFGFEFNTDLFKQVTIERFAYHLQGFIQHAINDPSLSLNEIEYLTDAEKQLVFELSNNTVVDNLWPLTLAMPDSLDQQQSDPDLNLVPQNVIQMIDVLCIGFSQSVALISGAESWTYGTLNAKSNQVAHFLQSRGVKEGEVIAIKMEPSIDMIVGILAILKIGATYVPIDPDYPEHRIGLILDDCNPKILICDTKTKFDCDQLSISKKWPEISRCSQNKPSVSLSSDSLAYIIYTSGSTGRPKGVMVSHLSLVNYLKNAKRNYIDGQIGENGTYLHLSLSFDASITSLFLPLVSGRSIVIATKGKTLFDDPQLFEHAPYDFIKMTPAHLEFYKDIQTKNFSTIAKKLVIGGEQLYKRQLDFLKDEQIVIFNEYGPTEATVGCSVFELNSSQLSSLGAIIPIGKPFLGTEMYILDENDKIVPIGVPGQIHIGGICLSKGYLNLPDVTANHFRDDYLIFGQRKSLYATGDLAKWLSNGNLEFIERVDNQIKINGYRIETGEIEAALCSSIWVDQAVVVTCNPEKPIIVAYIVKKADYDNEDLFAYLTDRLPVYMLPHYLIDIQEIPVNINGKVDRELLPIPGTTEDNRVFAPAKSELQSKMIAIWTELLNIPEIGIYDNLFALGADSILTIQFVSRLRHEEILIKPKDVFKQQTVNRLSLYIENMNEVEVRLKPDQEILSGECGLLPVQKYFFENAAVSIAHYNQSIILDLGKHITSEMIKECIDTILNHHDALRFKYSFRQGEWTQHYNAKNEKYFILEDFSEEPDSLISNKIENAGGLYQASLDLEESSLSKFIFFRTPESYCSNRLMIMVHHLLIDGVSWRILLEDFQTLFVQLANNQPLSLGEKTHSYRQWFNEIEGFGNRKSVVGQLEFWKSVCESFIDLPMDIVGDLPVATKDLSYFTTVIDRSLTEDLLRRSSAAYNTDINDLLLTSLSKTLIEKYEVTHISVGLEGHGREEEVSDIDVSRTIGWFTNIYPVILKNENYTDISDWIKGTKEQIRKIPNKGLSYGVLKYFGVDLAGVKNNPFNIMFNYLGQLDNSLNTKSDHYSLSKEPSGHAVSPEFQTTEILKITAMIVDGELCFNWAFSSKHFFELTIKELSDQLVRNMDALIKHCSALGKNKNSITPSDFGLSQEIGFKEMDRFLDKESKPAKKNIISF